MTKKIRLGIESLDLISRGVSTLASAVKVTLGPKGRTVILHRGFGSPHVTKDGVTVAKDVEFEDSVMQMSSELVKQVARKTADLAGDGTTTSISLIGSMFSNAYSELVTPSYFWGLIPRKFTKVNPMDLKSGMELAVRDTIRTLKCISLKIKNSEELKHIAMISSNGDESMGNCLFEVYDKLGTSVRITRDPNPSLQNSDVVTITEGFSFDRGYASPSFTNFKDNTICKLENPMFALFNEELKNFDKVIPFLELSFLVKRPLVVVAEDFDNRVLDALVKNSLNPKGSPILAIKTPGMGDKKQSNLEDIAAAVNYTLSITSGDTKNLKEEKLGSCQRIITTSFDTNIIVSASNNSLKKHLDFLEASLENSNSDYQKEVIRERLSKLTGKVAVISLHAKTEGEMLERIDRLDDAIEATKSAIEEGYIAGSGLPLYRISEYLSRRLPKLKLGEDQEKGYYSVILALREPFETILNNGGLDPDKVYQNIPSNAWNNDNPNPKNKYYTVGYNSRTDRYENLITEGVIDPVKVTRIALENAVSTSGVLLTTGCTISLN